MMSNNDKKQFSAMMFMLAEIFKETLSDARIEVYWKLLNPYNIADVLKAAETILQTKTIKVFPLPAEFIQLVDKPDAAALKAWDSTLKAIEVCGVYGSPTFHDPIVSHTINSFGGWVAFNMLSREQDESQWQWTRKEFLRVYKTLVYARNISKPCLLVGLHDKENHVQPQLPASQEVKRIGEVVNDLPLQDRSQVP